MPPLTLFPCFLVRTQLVDLSVCLLLLLLLLLTVVDHRHHGHHGPNCLLSGPTTCTTFTSPITFTTCFHHHLFTVYDCDLSTITAAAQWRVIRSIRARLTFAAVWATSSASAPAGRMSWRGGQQQCSYHHCFLSLALVSMTVPVYLCSTRSVLSRVGHVSPCLRHS